MWLKTVLAALVAVLVGAAPIAASMADTHYDASTYTYVRTSTPPLFSTVAATNWRGPSGLSLPSPSRTAESGLRFGVAAKAVDIGGAKFAQKTFSETFSEGGTLAGRTIDDVAGDLSSGVLSPKDVPIDVIVRDGNTLILNTRSSQALTRAGVPRSAWDVIDRTGQADFEARLTGQLTRNGLTSAGTDLP